LDSGSPGAPGAAGSPGAPGAAASAGAGAGAADSPPPQPKAIMETISTRLLRKKDFITTTPRSIYGSEVNQRYRITRYVQNAWVIPDPSDDLYTSKVRSSMQDIRGEATLANSFLTGLLKVVQILNYKRFLSEFHRIARNENLLKKLTLKHL
jgi:hypothetical protein